MDTLTSTPLPSLYLSHGSPMMALEPGAAGEFLKRLGPAIDTTFGRPEAVLVVSPHTATRSPYLLAAAQHDTIHDFGGFPAPLYEVRYDAPGAPALAQRAAELMRRQGLAVEVTPEGGLDHGIWTLLRYMWPKADVPVLPLSLVPTRSPAEQWRIGEALAPLAHEGVLIVGSGSLTHNLRMFMTQRPPVDAPETTEAAQFRGWVAEHSAARDWDALLDYRKAAPAAVAMHPTDEHWLPFYVAAGAGGRHAVPQRVHASMTYGFLAMDGYAFGPGAEALARRIQEID